MTEPDGIVVVPEPDCVPPFQLKAEVMLIDWEPVSVPVSVRVATVTGTSSVTTLPTLAVSPAPGTPTPPHVEELLQFPLCELVYVFAERGVAAATQRKAVSNGTTPERVIFAAPEVLRDKCNMPRAR